MVNSHYLIYTLAIPAQPNATYRNSYALQTSVNAIVVNNILSLNANANRNNFFPGINMNVRVRKKKECKDPK